MKNLTSLKIVAGNLISTPVINAVTQHLTQLKSLFLHEVVGYNDWNSFVSEDALMSISNLRDLEKLHFDGTFLPVNNRTVSEITSNCTKIEHLEFRKYFNFIQRKMFLIDEIYFF